MRFELMHGWLTIEARQVRHFARNSRQLATLRDNQRGRLGGNLWLGEPEFESMHDRGNVESAGSSTWPELVLVRDDPRMNRETCFDSRKSRDSGLFSPQRRGTVRIKFVDSSFQGIVHAIDQQPEDES